MPADVAFERFCAADADRDPPETVVVAAHPDDEAIGAGASMARLARACWVIHVTDGAPADRRFIPESAAKLTRAAYARSRRDEAVRALSVVGVDASRLVWLGLRDQEAVYDMAAAAERLAGILSEQRPEVVLTHAYEGGHPDHDAVAFIVHAAAALLRVRRAPLPTLVEMTSYHDQGGSTVRGEFLAVAGAREVVIELSDDERRRKRAMLGAYVSQREVLEPFKLEVERFRVAPRYDFGAPAHEGRLHYERFGLGLGGAMWRALARAAMKKLMLPEGKL